MVSQEVIKDALKKRKKVFVRQDYVKKKRLKKVWRYPRGIHSKLRHKKRGYGLLVKPGYKTPKLLRGRTIDGFRIVNVKNLKELESVAKEKDVLIQISRTVGKKKRLEILNKMLELKLKTNINVEQEINKIKKELDERKKLRDLKKKKTKVKKTEKKFEKKEKEKPKDIEEQKEKERKEFEKVLRTKQ